MSKMKLAVVPATTKTPLERLADEYLEDAKARGLSRSTRAGYLANMRQFLRWCSEEGLSEPAQIDQKALNRLSNHLREQGGARGPLSPHSIDSYLRHLNYFLSWARKEGRVGEAKAHRTRLPKLERETLSRDEIQHLEDAADNERDKVVIRLLADTGMRLGELLGMTGESLVADGRRYFVKVAAGTAKNREDRRVPLSPGLYQRVRKYAERARPREARCPDLFVSLRRSRKTGDYEPLEDRGVQQMLDGVAEKAGITKPTNPHIFRHSFVTWCVRRGMSPFQIAAIVGHKDLGMIQAVYAHLTTDDAYDAMMNMLRADKED